MKQMLGMEESGKQRSCVRIKRADSSSGPQAWACAGFCIKPARPMDSPWAQKPMAKCGNYGRESFGSPISVDCI
jgi:hypothetical protein